MLNYCGGNHCQIITFSLNDFPSHVQDDNLHAFRPLIIQVTNFSLIFAQFRFKINSS